MRTQQEDNAINRVLRARGLGTLEEPGTVAQLAYMVQDHLHFTELLRACEPNLRREMYEAMRPHLRFPALPLDWYDMEAKARAESAQLPLMDGNELKPYMTANIVIPEIEVHVTCRKCGKEAFFLGDRKADAIQGMRDVGWAWDEMSHESTCPECLDNGNLETDTR